MNNLAKLPAGNIKITPTRRIYNPALGPVSPPPVDPVSPPPVPGAIGGD